MSEGLMIEVANLTKRFAGHTAVSNISFTVRRGEVVGLLGPNGAGKSSTIKVLIGQRRPTAGQVTIFDHDIVREWPSIKPKFGYVPDRENHFDEFTGRRNLQFFAGLYGIDARRIDDCLKMVELDEAAETKVARYSTGMRRKLLIEALHHRLRRLRGSRKPDHLPLGQLVADLDDRSPGDFQRQPIPAGQVAAKSSGRHHRADRLKCDTSQESNDEMATR